MEVRLILHTFKILAYLTLHFIYCSKINCILCPTWNPRANKPWWEHTVLLVASLVASAKCSVLSIMCYVQSLVLHLQRASYNKKTCKVLRWKYSSRWQQPCPSISVQAICCKFFRKGWRISTAWEGGSLKQLFFFIPLHLFQKFHFFLLLRICGYSNFVLFCPLGAKFLCIFPPLSH